MNAMKKVNGGCEEVRGDGRGATLHRAVTSKAVTLKESSLAGLWRGA